MNRELKAEIVRQFGSQANLAASIGIDESRLSRIVNGRRAPSNLELQRLEERFGLDFKRLLQGAAAGATSVPGRAREV